MDALQFSLFFVAILVGYFLVHLRLIRFEEHLQRLAGLRSIDDRLRVLDERLHVLVETLGGKHFERIEAKLDRLHDDLEDLREATGEVRHAVVQIPAPVAPAVVDASAATNTAPRDSGSGRIAALVESRLLQLGYGNLTILTDLSAVRADREIEVQVECERGGMPAKGRVIVRNGSVRDVLVQSVAQMFP